MGSGAGCPRTNVVQSSAALPVPVVPTQVHPVFDGFAGPQPGGEAEGHRTGSGAGDEDAAKDNESGSVFRRRGAAADFSGERLQSGLDSWPYTRIKHVAPERPSLATCREHALQVHEPYGVWGGLT